jgi:hypothetical protein
MPATTTSADKTQLLSLPLPSKASMTHAVSELSTASVGPADTDDDHQLFFVTSYSDFDKLGKC